MKITAPISRIGEIEAQAAAGAHELYCGVVPQEWVARFNTGAVNRRFFGNLDSVATLYAAIEAAHRAGTRLFMVLNAQHYGETYQTALLELAQRFHEAGGDAVIVADLALVVLLHQRLPMLTIHLSSVAGCRNSAGIDFYRDLGVRRVILPRDVTLDEIEGMARAANGIELEVFALNDGCVFEEGTCHSLHLPSKLGGPICIDERPFEYRDAKGRPISERMTRKLRENDADYKRWLWYRFGCGFSTTQAGYPFGPCGLCAIARLTAAGVASVKIAGREGPTERKTRSTAMVRAVLDRLEAGAQPQAAAAFAVGLRQTEDHCRSGFMCYYPETRWQADQ